MMRFSLLTPGEEFERNDARYIKNDDRSYQTITNVDEGICIKWFLVTEDFTVRRCDDRFF
jgi:hypothetical protein